MRNIRENDTERQGVHIEAEKTWMNEQKWKQKGDERWEIDDRDRESPKTKSKKKNMCWVKVKHFFLARIHRNLW